MSSTFKEPKQEEDKQNPELLEQGMSYSDATKTHLFWLICILSRSQCSIVDMISSLNIGSRPAQVSMRKNGEKFNF